MLKSAFTGLAAFSTKSDNKPRFVCSRCFFLGSLVARCPVCIREVPGSIPGMTLSFIFLQDSG